MAEHPERTEHPEHTDAPERIEWLELFFDLVVVAAVAVLTEGCGRTRRAAASGSSW